VVRLARSTESRTARAIFERAFREYGLPAAIWTDNGVPFATTGLHGLSLLSVWWSRLGIQPQRVLPAHPEQNGAHERMHKTLKRGAIRPPRATLAAQQRAFTAYRTQYNDERPHDALDGTTPTAHYRPSARVYPAQLPTIEWAFRGEAYHRGRHLSLQGPPVLSEQRVGSSPRRPRGGRRRALVRALLPLGAGRDVVAVEAAMVV
jgi:hypothetical protein